MTVKCAPRGQIILLNGTSSSGKTSIAEQLLQILETPYFHMGVDAVNGMRARERTLELDPTEFQDVLARTRSGFHRAVVGMAQAGNNVVADLVLSERWRLLDCLTVMAGYDVGFVGVQCSVDELERRERARGDRQVGQAASQLAQVHNPGIYDVVCDTSVNSPRDCALQIKAFLTRRTTPSAFEQLRAVEWRG